MIVAEIEIYHSNVQFALDWFRILYDRQLDLKLEVLIAVGFFALISSLLIGSIFVDIFGLCSGCSLSFFPKSKPPSAVSFSLFSTWAHQIQLSCLECELSQLLFLCSESFQMLFPKPNYRFHSSLVGKNVNSFRSLRSVLFFDSFCSEVIASWSSTSSIIEKTPSSIGFAKLSNPKDYENLNKKIW